LFKRMSSSPPPRGWARLIVLAAFVVAITAVSRSAADAKNIECSVQWLLHFVGVCITAETTLFFLVADGHRRSKDIRRMRHGMAVSDQDGYRSDHAICFAFGYTTHGKTAAIKTAKADNTLRTSRAVPHPTTNRALCHLTPEAERDPLAVSDQDACMSDHPLSLSPLAPQHLAKPP
jgi:hypothetical protein